MAHKSPELQDEFLYNAETQRNLTKSGEQLTIRHIGTEYESFVDGALLAIRYSMEAKGVIVGLDAALEDAGES